jgi:hypothetical protein
MKKWTRASNYMGEEYPEYYIAYGKNRDSDAMTRANFDEILFRLGGESKTVLVIRSGHWACGWIETILIHESDVESVAEGNKIEAQLSEYPVLDDERWSQYQNGEVYEYWKPASLSERVSLCKDAKIPIFAARRDDAPMLYDRLFEMLTN